MNVDAFRNLSSIALKFVQDNAPNPKTRGVGYYMNAYGNWQKCSTGNLAFDATKIEHESDKQVMIYVDEDIAPYMPYTNEPWISPKWNGKKNPNEGWFDRVAEDLAYHVAQIVHGVVIMERK